MNHYVFESKIQFYISILALVCTDIKVVTKKWGNENSWIFGNCANSQTYKSKQIYTEKCCQLEGEYELICKDSFGDGWHGGYLEIDGTKYCTDFKQGSEQATEAPMSGMHNM